MTEWKKVPNYNYEVSNFGEVRNAKTKKILKQGLGTSDYYRVSFSLGCKGTPKIMFVHRLIAMAFIQNPENKPVVNHIDGNKLNNSISNLEWVTYKENTEHAIRIGLIDSKLLNNQAIGATSKSVSVLNTMTLEEVIYPSISECARTIGVPITTLSRWVNENVQKGTLKFGLFSS